MRRLFTILIAIFAFFTAAAQEEYSIILDQNSFRKVQTDALTGVNIDPIAKDASRNACARLKIKFKDMSRAEVDALAVKFQSNTDIARQEVAPYFDNVLIIEVTAKPATRFYVKSPEYGESNEVSLNLEGNCEYEMEARLNQTFSIVVDTNVAEADVYIDGFKKARTDASCRVTIKEVMIGEHTIKVDYKGVTAEQKIIVNGDNISFRVNVNTEASKPQYVVFNVVPQNAYVTIDNKSYTPEDGSIKTRLYNGVYQYSVSARLYHTQSGTFTISGAKVEQNITLQPAFGYLSVGGGVLDGAAVFVDDEHIGTAPVKSDKLASGEHTVRIVKSMYKSHSSTVVIRDNQTTTHNPTLAADFATVTITSVDGADIYVNDTKKGTSRWSGKLSTGVYLIEARKAGYRNHSINVDISATPANQSYTLPALTAITGSVDIDANAIGATITLDGKTVGTTPIYLDNLLIGQHTIKLTKNGYNDYTQTFTVAEGKTTTVNATLTKHQISTPIPTSTPDSYQIGDLVTVNGVQGIVFQTSPVVKIVSVKEGKTIWGEYGVTTNATDEDNGKANMAIIKSISGWETKYPAFKWCADYGNGWYLPALNELKAIYAQRDKINKTLSANNMDKLGSKNEYSYLWSSSELGSYYAYYFSFSLGNDYSNYLKSNYRGAVRAVYVITSYSNATSASVQTPTPSVPSSVTPAPKTYNIGDLVTVKGVQGIVFQTSPVVKIVSVKEGYTDWGVYGATTSATNRYTGKANMAKIESISGWQSKYPAFKWCADLGDGWYLPAINELEAIYKQRDKINRALSANGFDSLGSKTGALWSSTEYSHYNAYKLSFSNGYSSSYDKIYSYNVRAVLALN